MWLFHVHGRGSSTSLLLRILFIMLVPDTAVRNGLNTLIYQVISVGYLIEPAVNLLCMVVIMLIGIVRDDGNE
jgi:hypothetical protein